MENVEQVDGLGAPQGVELVGGTLQGKDTSIAREQGPHVVDLEVQNDTGLVPGHGAPVVDAAPPQSATDTPPTHAPRPTRPASCPIASRAALIRGPNTIGSIVFAGQRHCDSIHVSMPDCVGANPTERLSRAPSRDTTAPLREQANLRQVVVVLAEHRGLGDM